MINIQIPEEAIKDLCRKWRVSEFSFFGSVLRDDFRPESDIDVLVTFEREAPWDLFDIVEMRQDLETLFGRPVDLVEEDAITNPYRRRSILGTKETVVARPGPPAAAIH